MSRSPTRTGCALALVAALSGCDARLELAISGDDVDLQGARIQIEVHASGGGGCEALAFRAAPETAPLSVAVVDAGSLVVPRVGDKLIVAEASNDDGVIGRGCLEVGDVSSTTAAHLVITPTTSLRDLPTTTPVFGEAAGTVVATVVDAKNTPRRNVVVQARVLDGFGAILVDNVLTSDANGVVTFTPPLHNSGPVVVELVPRQPRSDGDRAEIDAWVAAPVDDIVLDADTDVVPVVLDDGPQFVAARVVDGAFVVSRVALDGTSRSGTISGETSSLRVLLVHHHRSLGGTDLDRDLVWLQTRTRLLVVDLATLEPIDELDFETVQDTTAVLVGDCRSPAHHGPALVVHDGNVDIVDLAFDRITLVGASPALVGAVRSGCVSDDDDDGRVRRLVVTSDGVHSLGAGLASIRVAEVEPQPVQLEDPASVVHIGFRADHTALVVRFDGGSTVMTPHRLVGAALVPRTVVNDLPQRLPATPLLVQQGPMFGGSNDVLTLLPAGGPNDSAALYGRSGTAASGVVGICSPRRACAASVVSDVDGDDVLDLLTVAATAVDVRARTVRSR